MYLTSLPDEARLWIWAADRPLDPNEQAAILSAMERFLADWTSHGRRIRGEVQVVHDRLLLLGGVIPEGDISGCGIDKSVHVLESVADEIGIDWLSGLDVVFRDPATEGLRSMTRREFREAAKNGEISSAATIIDRSVTSLADLRAGLLETVAASSWASRYFRSEPTETRAHPGIIE